MIFSSHVGSLIRQLGRSEPKVEALTSLSRVLEDQTSRDSMTLRQLWKVLDLSDGSLELLGDDDPRRQLLIEINSNANREIQLRNLRGV